MACDSRRLSRSKVTCWRSIQKDRCKNPGEEVRCLALLVAWVCQKSRLDDESCLTKLFKSNGLSFVSHMFNLQLVLFLAAQQALELVFLR